MNDDYTKKLEYVIKQMLTPLKKVPLKLVIESLSGNKVLSFNSADPKDKVLLDNLKKVANKAGTEVNKRGIFRTRPNEVGNDIEPFVKQALTSIGYKSGTPKIKSGSMKATGYPDIEFKDKYDRTCYLECKTFNRKNIFTTQRSFYLSPSDKFKITKDAHHFVMSFEGFEYKRSGQKNVYKCNSWKILSLEDLDVDVKYEFNAHNARLYEKKLVIAEGKL